jgi:hypothetical protein
VAFDFDDFCEKDYEHKYFFLEVNNGNVLGDLGQKWLHDFRNCYPRERIKFWL